MPVASQGRGRVEQAADESGGHPGDHAPHQDAGVSQRQRTQQHGIDEAEHRGIGPDAQREDEDREARDGWRPHEAAQAVANVLGELVEHGHG